jgi:hypothetical protein
MGTQKDSKHRTLSTGITTFILITAFPLIILVLNLWFYHKVRDVKIIVGGLVYGVVFGIAAMIDWGKVFRRGKNKDPGNQE